MATRVCTSATTQNHDRLDHYTQPLLLPHLHMSAFIYFQLIDILLVRVYHENKMLQRTFFPSVHSHQVAASTPGQGELL